VTVRGCQATHQARVNLRHGGFAPFFDTRLSASDDFLPTLGYTREEPHMTHIRATPAEAVA
jgi:hypothetical protein